MWVFFDGGFVSIVRFRGSASELLVRARAKEDLEAFCNLGRAGLIQSAIVETPDNDYRFRTRLASAAVGRALARIATKIEYPNFKDHVAAVQGKDRAMVYGRVWATCLALDERQTELMEDRSSMERGTVRPWRARS